MTGNGLIAGRAALAEYDWNTGYTLLCDHTEQLTARDLEALGEAAFWTSRPDDCIRFRERSFAAYTREHRPSDAARIALKLLWDYFAQRSVAVAQGWLAKAKRLLADRPECREHGVLANALAHLDIPQGKLDAALAGAREAFGIGERIGDPNLQAEALNTEGSILIRMGEIAQGMACIDESMASAIGGELEPWTTAAVYCTTISACQRIGDVRRATEWTDAAEKCAQRPGMQDFPGDCRFHRVSILRVTGHWDEAEAAAERAVKLVGAEASHVATVHQEVGEMRLYRGQFEAAEEAFRHAEDLGRTPQPGRALLCLAQGEVEAAVSFITAALENLTWDRLARARLLPAQVEIALATERPGDARRAADELLDIAATYETIAISAAARQAHGRVLGAEGDATNAATNLREAMQLWLELPAPFEAACVRLELANILGRSARVDEARLEARAALGAFERLGAKPNVQRTSRMLEEFDKTRLARTGSHAVRITRTFVFTDIVGSTNLLEAIGDDAWRNVVRLHDQILRAAFAEHGGEEIDHAGDGFFVAFESVDPALDCVIAIQQALARHRQEHGFSPSVRIGAHMAEATSDVEGYSGKGVHHAARIGGLAGADEILVSQETIEAADGTRPCGDVRSVNLKGIAEPRAVVLLHWQ